MSKILGVSQDVRGIFEGSFDMLIDRSRHWTEGGVMRNSYGIYISMRLEYSVVGASDIFRKNFKECVHSDITDENKYLTN